MNIESFLKAIEYRFDEGSKFQWKCFGNNARFVDYGNDTPGYDISCVYDCKTGEIYSISVFDYNESIEYRYMNPMYKDAYFDEEVERNINPESEDSDLKTIDLDVELDIMERIEAVVAGVEMDKRVLMGIDLPEKLWYELMKMAHERDITLNQLISEILQQAIDKELNEI